MHNTLVRATHGIKKSQKYFITLFCFFDTDTKIDLLGVTIPYKSTLKQSALSHFLALAKKHESFFHRSDFVFNGTNSPAKRNCNDIVDLFTSTTVFAANGSNPPKILELEGQFLPKRVEQTVSQLVFSDLYKKN